MEGLLAKEGDLEPARAVSVEGPSCRPSPSLDARAKETATDRRSEPRATKDAGPLGGAELPIVLSREPRPFEEPDKRPTTIVQSTELHITGTARDSALLISRSAQPAASPLRPSGELIRAPKGLRRSVQNSERALETASVQHKTLAQDTSRSVDSETGLTTPAPPAGSRPGFDTESATRISRETSDHPQGGRAVTNSRTQSSENVAIEHRAEESTPRAGIESQKHTAPQVLRMAPVTEVEHRSPTTQVKPSSMQYLSEEHHLALSKPSPVIGGQSREDRGAGIRPAPVQQAATRLPGPASDRRRRQISIGRIDVQVNSTSTAASLAPPPARPRVQLNFLEARFLNRFSLKP